MQKSIRDIADLYSGLYVNTSAFKGSIVYYLQVGHWDKEREWSSFIEPELGEGKKLSKHYLQNGDILLATKGIDHSAVLYDGRYKPAIASSVFTVLRIKDTNTVFPAYLQWYLNHPATAKKLIAGSQSTSMPMITRNVIEQLAVPLPSLNTQRNIVQTQRLHRQTTQLRSRISQLDETIFHYNLLQTANR